MGTYSLRFIIGMMLLLTNQVVGWAGLVAGAFLSRKTRRKIFYTAGTGVYVFSWGMVFAGLWLAGPEGLARCKHIFAEYRTAMLITVAALLTVTLFYVWKKKRKTIEEVIIPASEETEPIA